MRDFPPFCTWQALGNHEFDNIHGLGEFLDNVDFPVLCCNLNTSAMPRLQSILPSIEVTVRGETIGIIGYITTDVVNLVHPGK